MVEGRLSFSDPRSPANHLQVSRLEEAGHAPLPLPVPYASDRRRPDRGFCGAGGFCWPRRHRRRPQDVSRVPWCRGSGCRHCGRREGFRRRRATAAPGAANVFSGVAGFTRVCAYDRPGTPVGQAPSRSDPVPQPTTAADSVADLHALLAAAGIATPVVLVGHSYGGLVVRLYARYPSRRGGRDGSCRCPDGGTPGKRRRVTSGRSSGSCWKATYGRA